MYVLPEWDWFALVAIDSQFGDSPTIGAHSANCSLYYQVYLCTMVVFYISFPVKEDIPISHRWSDRIFSDCPWRNRKWLLIVAAVVAAAAFIQFRPFVAIEYWRAAIQFEFWALFSLRLTNLFYKVFYLQYELFSIEYFVPPTSFVPYQKSIELADFFDDVEYNLPSLLLDLLVALGFFLFFVHFLYQGPNPCIPRIPDQRYALSEQDITQLRTFDDVPEVREFQV